MMVKPWAKAIATIPGKPTPSPTTAAAPAPMNTNAKVPMNSARSLGAREFDVAEFDIADLQKWACVVLLGATSLVPENHVLVCGSPTTRESGSRRRRELELLRGDHLRRE